MFAIMFAIVLLYIVSPHGFQIAHPLV